MVLGNAQTKRPNQAKAEEKEGKKEREERRARKGRFRFIDLTSTGERKFGYPTRPFSLFHRFFNEGITIKNTYY